MGKLGREERSAVEAVAKNFSATWQEGDDPPDAYLMHGGRRIAIDVLQPWSSGRAGPAKPRLRYDRVAVRFVRDLRERLRPLLASGEAAILTIRAPILQAGKSVDAIEERLRSRRAARSGKAELKARDFGNEIGILLLPNAGRAAEVLGFVHSEGSNPGVIANAAESLLACLRARDGNSTLTAKGARWLILRGTSAHGDTYRDACSQLSNAAPFEKIVLVAEGGRVETIAG